jgi:hypothetical protein
LNIKAEILNSASKQVRDPNDPVTADVSWPVWRAANYNSMALPDGVVQVSNSQPLNNAMGVGQLNGFAALRADVVGGVSDVGSQSNTAPADGTTTSNLSVGAPPLTPGSLVTATLAWDRVVTLNDATHPSDTTKYTVNAIPNLDLELVNQTTGDTVALSNSGANAATGGNNVEHLYVNVPTTGNYNLVVRNRSGTATPYALAWTSGSSDGLTFTVNSGAQGRNALGSNAQWPNDVNSLGPNGPGNYPVGGELFSSAANGTNQLRLSGALQTRSRVGPFNGPPAALNLLDPANNRGVLGLQAGDQLTAMAFGDNGTATTPGRVADSVMLFSVSPGSQGANNTAVSSERTAMRQAGDIFKSSPLTPFGSYSSPRIAPAAQVNQVMYTGAQLGLQAGNAQQDDLRDFKLENIRSRVDPDGDGVHNAPVFFALAANSPTLTGSGGALTPNEIRVSKSQDNNAKFNPDTQGANFAAASVYASANAIGLQAGDKINSLVLSDTGPNGQPDGILQPFVDMNNPFDSALFTLTPDSPSLGAIFQGSAADIFYTAFDGRFSVFTSYNELGLASTDVIDGLDIASVPEPATLVLLSLGFVGLAVWRRRMKA